MGARAVLLFGGAEQKKGRNGPLGSVCMPSAAVLDSTAARQKKGLSALFSIVVQVPLHARGSKRDREFCHRRLTYIVG